MSKSKVKKIRRFERRRWSSLTNFLQKDPYIFKLNCGHINFKNIISHQQNACRGDVARCMGMGGE